MADWVAALLLVVFLIHLAIFARLALRRREAYYFAVTTTFTLLVIAFGLRLIGPELRTGGLLLHELFRTIAWVSAAISIGWLLARRFHRKASRER